MTETRLQYSIGDWVVHRQYGVGQVKKIEVKPIQGEQAKCFKVKTKDCLFWFPINKPNNPRVRRVASQEVVQKAIQVLRNKPCQLDTDKKHLKGQIDHVQSDGDVLAISKLIRDLSAQQAIRKLNHSEENALGRFKERLLREWAASMQIKVEKIRPILHAYLQESKSKIMIDDSNEKRPILKSWRHTRS
ncbi:MAG: hypothetical protein KKD28_14235 [Chloroflexi bacterium]|nr:hypothetical protein [Chloroflexota bacterium]